MSPLSCLVARHHRVERLGHRGILRVLLFNFVFDIHAVAAVGTIREFPQCVNSAKVELRKIYRSDGKRARWDAIYEERDARRSVVLILQVVSREHGIELFLQELRIGRADTKDDFRANVADDRVAYLLVKLRDKLVGNDEREIVFSSFRKNGADGGCCEVLELVYVEIEHGQITRPRINTRERRLQEFRDENKSQE